MTQGARTADICTRLSLLIRALVTDRDTVSVTSISAPSGDPVIVVEVNPQDLDYIMGRDNIVASSLCILLTSIGERHGVRYLLNINGNKLYKDPPRIPEWAPVSDRVLTPSAVADL